MRNVINVILFLFAFTNLLKAQNNALILNGAVYVTLKGGTSGTPIRLIVNQSNANGISRPVANNGWIVSEGEYNYVQWNIATSTGNYVVPFNYSNTDIPLSMNITSAGVGGTSVLFSTYHNAASDNLPIATYNGSTLIPNINNASGANNSAKMLDRWWIIDATNGYTTKPAATLTFSYIDAEWSVASNSISEGNLQAQSYNTSTSRWEIADLFGTDVSGSNYVNNAVVPATKLFRAWVLVDKTSPLPIELLNFSATCRNREVLLGWTTSSEINNDFFSIEKSNDGSFWYVVATIQGAGNSNLILNYSYYDSEISESTTYYRLKQTDFDGAFNYSQPIAVNCKAVQVKGDFSNLIIYSGATNPGILISFNGVQGEPYYVALIDQLGRKLFTKQYITASENEKIIIPTAGYALGIYHVVLNNSVTSISKQVPVLGK